MKRTQVYHSVVEWLKAVDAYKNVTATIFPDGVMVIKSKGMWYTKKEWDEANPKPVYEPRSGNNLNGESTPLMYGVRITKKGR